MSIDYRKKFKNEKACASCSHVRDRAKDIQSELRQYTGGKRAICAKSGANITMRDEPDRSKPTSECWESIKKNGVIQ